MKVTFVGQLEKWPNAPDHLGIKQGAENLGWDFSSVEVEDVNPAEQVNDLGPDLVIHGNTDSLGRCLPSQIRPDISQVFLMLDYRTPDMLPLGEWEKWTTQAPHIDAVFISAKGHIQMWERAFNVPVFFAPHACWIPPTLKYYPEFDHDILFIGGHHTTGSLAARYHLIQAIKKKLERSGLSLTEINATALKERNEIWSDQPKLYFSSKVVLDVSHFWENPGYCSGRYWYTATFGACAVTRRFPDCEDFFKDVVHKYYFDTPDEAMEMIEGLLSLSNEERQVLRDEVTTHAWEQHSYEIRFSQMLMQLTQAKEKALV